MLKKIVIALLLISQLVDCKINEQVKGEPPVKTPRLLPPSKSRLVEPTTTTTQATTTTTTTNAPIEQVKQLRIVEEIPQQRLEEPQRIQQQIILQQQQDDRKHIRQQEEALLQLKQQHEINIRQQLQQQRKFEQQVQQVQQEEKTANCEPQPVKGKVVQKIEQVIEQKQARLTEEEEAIAEPFPLIPKTSFTCEGKPILPGLYADEETGCRVYHYCAAPAPVKANIVQQQQQLQELEPQQPELGQLQDAPVETEQFKSFFCGEGTLFSQKLLVCDHTTNVVCSDSARYYATNEGFGKPSAEPAAGVERAQLQQSKTAPIKQQQVIEQQRWTWEPQQPLLQLQVEPQPPTKRPSPPPAKGPQRLEQEPLPSRGGWSGSSSWRTEHSSHSISRTSWGGAGDRSSNDELTSGSVGRRMTESNVLTEFSCESKPFQTGLYTGPYESDCVMYHQCLNGRKTSFKCAPGQKFDQRTLSCASEHKVNCADSEKYYDVNSRFN